MKALFCKHEGYCGAVGCLQQLMKTQQSSSSKQMQKSEKTEEDQANAKK